MSSYDVIGKKTQSFNIFAGSKIFKCSHSHVALSNSCKDRTWEELFPHYFFACKRCGKGSCGWYSQSIHSLAYDVFPQDWAKHRSSITHSGKWRWTRSLQLDITANTIKTNEFAQ